MAIRVFTGFGASASFDNIHILSEVDVGFDIQGHGNKITNCQVGGNVGLTSDFVQRLQISNTYFEGHLILNGPEDLTMKGVMAEGIAIDDGFNLDLDLQIEDFAPLTDYAVEIANVEQVKLSIRSGNGVHLDTVDGFSLDGIVGPAWAHGVFIEDSMRGVDSIWVNGASQQNDQTFQGKNITGSDDVKVAGGVKNMGLSENQDYGVEIDATSTNIEIDCHLHNSGVVGPINNLAGFEVWTHARISTEDPNDGDVLVWDEANDIYRPEAGGGGGGGSDADAIHDNVAGEIAAVTEKATPVSADLILIEDSADSNNKKRVQVGNLPGGSGGAAPVLATILTRTTSYNIVNNTPIHVRWQSGGVIRDDDTWWDDETTDEIDARVTVNDDGLYWVHGTLRWPDPTNVHRISGWVSVNTLTGFTHGYEERVTDSTNDQAPTIHVQCILPLSAGDYIRLFAFQNSGDTLGLQTTYTRLEVARWAVDS